MLNIMRDQCHQLAVDCGWWVEERNDGELICLMHSELSEAMEGLRKDLQDPHVPERKNIDVELADCIIRILDFCGARGIDIAGAVSDKLDYNKTRADHRPENRAKAGGKSF